MVVHPPDALDLRRAQGVRAGGANVVADVRDGRYAFAAAAHDQGTDRVCAEKAGRAFVWVAGQRVERTYRHGALQGRLQEEVRHRGADLLALHLRRHQGDGRCLHRKEFSPPGSAHAPRCS